MEKTFQFLKDAGTFFLATAEKDQARVRPFGAVCKFKDKLYICTNKNKECFKQMISNPKVEISAMLKGKWIRLAGEVVQDTSVEAKTAMLEAYPSLRKMYSLEDGIFEVLYFSKGIATFYSFNDKPEVETLA